MQQYLQSKKSDIDTEIEISEKNDWLLRSELAGFLISELPKRGSNFIISNSIDLAASLRDDLKNKLIDYNPKYYMKHFNIEETISTSSTETEDNPKKKTTQNKNRKNPLYFHQDGKYCEMESK